MQGTELNHQVGHAKTADGCSAKHSWVIGINQVILKPNDMEYNVK